MVLESLDQKYHRILCPRCKEKFEVKMKDEFLEQKRKELDDAKIKEKQMIGGREAHASWYAPKCGNCGNEVISGLCPLCNIKNTYYVQPSYETPKSLRNLMYFTIICFGTFILAIFSETLRTGDFVCTLARFAFLIAGFTALYLIINSQMERIKKKGFGYCFKCKQEISPKSKFCIYCGKRAFWQIPKSYYIAIAIVLILVTILVLLLAANQPASLRIEDVSYPSQVYEDTIPVEIKLINEGGKTAEREDIEIEISGVGIETKTINWHEDIEPRTSSSRTVNVNVEPGSQWYSIRVTLYYKGEFEDYE